MKKTAPLLLSLFFFLLLASLSSAQDNAQKVFIDSLEKYSSDSLKNLSQDYRYSNIELAKIYAEALYNRGKTTNNLKDLVNGYIQLGLIGEVTGNYKKSIEHFDKGINITKSINDTLLLIELYLIKGNSLLYLKEYENVLVNYNTALKLSKKINNNQYVIASNINIASLKKEVGLFEEALEIERRNLKISKNIVFGNKTTPVNLIMNLGETFLKLKENDSAIYYNKIALGKSLLIDNLEGTAFIYRNIGLAYYNKKEFTRAIRNFDEAISVIKPFGNKQLLSELYFHKGQSYYQSQNIKKALTSLKASEEIITQNNAISKSSIILIDTYKLLAEIYKEINDHKKSGNYFEKYVALDKKRDESKIKTITGIHQSNLHDKNNTIASLSSITKNQQKKQSLFILISTVIILTILIVLLFYFFNKPKKNMPSFQNVTFSNQENIESEKIKSSLIKITDTKTKAIIDSLDSLEKKEFFLDPNFSLITVAKKVKTNPTYLSKIINTHKNLKFQEYVNQLRINYAVNRLKKDKKFRSYSIEHISKELGYKSPNSFTKHFKDKTGIYPSLYISNVKSL